MLVEFKVSNYRSFKEEQVFSMVASSDSTLPENLAQDIVVGKQRVLRTSVLYGANAAGKSNLISAVNFFKKFIGSSAERKPGVPTGVRPFQLDSSTASLPTSFEITFILAGVRYQYGFSLDVQKIHEEYLIAYPKKLPQTWFHRKWIDVDHTDWYYGSQLKGDKRRIESLTRADVLFLSVAATFNQQQLEPIYTWLSNNLRVIDLNTEVHIFERVTAQQLQRDELRGVFARMLQMADLGIVDATVEEIKELPEEMPNELKDLILKGVANWSGYYNIQLHHEVVGAEKATVPFDLEDESLGTRRFFALLGPWIGALSSGYAVFVDELDASLHPLLVRTLVSLFHNNRVNPKNAQLIFNTHDITLLDTSLFRRDQIWFVEKDKQGASHIYPLLDYSPRKGESLSKGYLRGRYGAIPFIKGWAESILDYAEEQTESK